MSATPATYGDGYKRGLIRGETQAVKKLAKLEANPDSVVVLKARLHAAEDIVDWIVAHFDYEKAHGRRVVLNDHIEIHVREQQAMRGPR